MGDSSSSCFLYHLCVGRKPVHPWLSGVGYGSPCASCVSWSTLEGSHWWGSLKCALLLQLHSECHMAQAFFPPPPSAILQGIGNVRGYWTFQYYGGSGVCPRLHSSSPCYLPDWFPMTPSTDGLEPSARDMSPDAWGQYGLQCSRWGCLDTSRPFQWRVHWQPSPAGHTVQEPVCHPHCKLIICGA